MGEEAEDEEEDEGEGACHPQPMTPDRGRTKREGRRKTQNNA